MKMTTAQFAAKYESVIEKLRKYVAKVNQYNPYSLSQLIIEKTFNEGMGSLALFRFYPDQKKVAINHALYNKYDAKHLDKILSVLGYQDFERVMCEYGYPEWYNHNFGLKYAIQ